MPVDDTPAGSARPSRAGGRSNARAGLGTAERSSSELAEAVAMTRAGRIPAPQGPARRRAGAGCGVGRQPAASTGSTPTGSREGVRRQLEALLGRPGLGRLASGVGRRGGAVTGDPDAVVCEQVVAAPPGEVFRWFVVDADLLARWIGIRAALKPWPGGASGSRSRRRAEWVLRPGYLEVVSAAGAGGVQPGGLGGQRRHPGAARLLHRRGRPGAALRRHPGSRLGPHRDLAPEKVRPLHARRLVPGVPAPPGRGGDIVAGGRTGSLPHIVARGGEPRGHRRSAP